MQNKKSMRLHAAELNLLKIYEADRSGTDNRSGHEFLKAYRKAVENWAILATAPPLIEPPGEIIREEIKARGWTQTDLAEIMGRPAAAVNEIINGKRKITARTAAQLGAAFDTDPKFWLNLESSYQLNRPISWRKQAISRPSSSEDTPDAK